jgi:hypothetical protein
MMRNNLCSDFLLCVIWQIVLQQIVPNEMRVLVHISGLDRKKTSLRVVLEAMTTPLSYGAF